MKGSRRQSIDDGWNEDAEANMAASMAIGLFSMALKFGMYLSFPLHVAMLVVGIIHRDDCPANRRIPWYLIFGGLAGILSVALRVIMILAWSCIRGDNKGVKYDPISHPALAMVRAVHYLFRLFVIAWNLTATFHIYSVVPDFEDEKSPMFCNEGTYLLAYILVIIFDVLVVIVIIIWVSALITGMIFPEMVENLYEDDDDVDVASTTDSHPEIELEEDEHSMREKQRKRRRKRRQKRLMKEQQQNMIIVKSNTLPIFSAPQMSYEDELTPLEDKNNMSAVRFSSLVDSRRISKDYYSQLMQESTPTPTTSPGGPLNWPGSNAPGAQRLKNLFHPMAEGLGEVSEEVA